MAGEVLADKVFELTVYSLKYENKQKVDAIFDNADKADFHIIVNDSGEGNVTALFVSVNLLSVDVNKRIGTHNNIKVRLKIVQSTTNDEQKLNVTMLKNAFLGRKIRLDMIKDGKSYVIAENYYVFGAKPIKYNSDGVATYYVDLNIYSWDKLMDITKHSKSYAQKKLGGDILKGFVESYSDKYKDNNDSDSWKCETSGMRVMVKSSDGDGNEELVFPFLEQYNETDYNFLLRNANKCGEFLYFENGTLNLGLTRVMNDTNEEVVTEIDETLYASIESLSDEINEINEDETLKAFVKGGKSAGRATAVYTENESNSINESGTKEEIVEDTPGDWNDILAPKWSRMLAHLFASTTVSDFFLEWGWDEADIEVYNKRMAKTFNDDTKDYRPEK